MSGNISGVHRGEVQATYERLARLRQPYLDRARDASKLTIPSLVPPEGFTGSSKLYQPWQGIGARGVNNLAAKLLLALLPPNAPFFRLKVDKKIQKQVKEAEQAGGEGLSSELERGLSEIERDIVDEIEVAAIRPQLFETFKHVIVAGNVLLYKMEDTVKVFHLDKYVVSRDPSGQATLIIIKECMEPETCPPRIREVVGEDVIKAKLRKKDGNKTIDVFTQAKLEGDTWIVHQEVCGKRVPDSDGSWPKGECRFIPLRFTRIDGEDYGRGYVEEYLGDLTSLEILMRAIVEGSAAAARVLFLVRPNGTTDERDLDEAPNGAVRIGDKDDVSAVQVEKFADFRTAREVIEMLQQRLHEAFLLNSAVQRNAERVTAEEIRYVAGELEDALGGVYSILSQECQLPLAITFMADMRKQGKLRLPKNAVRPTIITGLEALGRGHDLQKLDLFIAGMAENFGPDEVKVRINSGEYATRRATALGLDTSGLVRSDEDIQAQQEQAMQMQMLQQFGPEAMKQLGAAAQTQMKGEQAMAIEQQKQRANAQSNR